MARTYILAIDQGTTNTKVLMFDQQGVVVARASRPIRIAFPAPGWVEQNAVEIWRSTADAVDECLSGLDGDAAAIGVTNQRETVVAWDRRTGVPVGPCIVWQCRRTTPACECLSSSGLEPKIRAKTGLPIDPLFSATKARWLLDHTPDGHARAASGDLCLGTMDSWLLWQLTGGAVHACDVSNASRTQLLDIGRGAWDAELLDVFGIPLAALPRVVPSSGVAGRTAATGALAAGIPIASLIGDSHAALFGHAAFAPGTVKATYGTGTSLMTALATLVPSSHGVATTIAWALQQQTTYALEGNITLTGGGVEWLGQLMGLSEPARGISELALGVADTGGVYLVPALAGLGAPHWDPDARGLMCGLTQATTAAHLARASLEAIAYQVRDVFGAMQAQTSSPLVQLLADGGASANDMLMQFQADLLGCPVVRDRSGDLSARGAAWLAGLAAGVWSSEEELAQLPRATDRFVPQMSERERARLYGGWQDALARVRRRRTQTAGPPEPVASSRHGAH
jgi:glycerol kinase